MNHTKVGLHVLLMNEFLEPFGQIGHSNSEAFIKYGLEAIDEHGANVYISKTDLGSTNNPISIM